MVRPLDMTRGSFRGVSNHGGKRILFERTVDDYGDDYGIRKEMINRSP